MREKETQVCMQQKWSYWRRRVACKTMNWRCLRTFHCTSETTTPLAIAHLSKQRCTTVVPQHGCEPGVTTVHIRTYACVRMYCNVYVHNLSHCMLFHPTQTLSTCTYIRKGYACTYVSALWIWKCVKHTWNIRSPIQCISALSAPLLHIATREPTLHHSNFRGAIARNSIILVALLTSQEFAGHWSHSHVGSAPQWRSSRKYVYIS